MAKRLKRLGWDLAIAGVFLALLILAALCMSELVVLFGALGRIR